MNNRPPLLLEKKFTILDTPVDELPISQRFRNVLSNNMPNDGIVRNLVLKKKHEVARFSGCGKGLISELDNTLYDYGLRLGMQPHELDEDKESLLKPINEAIFLLKTIKAKIERSANGLNALATTTK